MKLSTILALCAAPLALAGSLDVHMGRSLGRRTSSNQPSKDTKDTKDSSKSGSNVIVASNTVIITEIIIIWVNPGNNAATTTVTQAASNTGAAALATHTVIVGGAAGLVFTPNQISAAVGDMVVFTFMSQNHTVTQSAFATPCDPLAGGMDSGFMANPNNTLSPAPQMAMQVTVATPIWFYCRQNGHCAKGMTFSINPTADKTQAMFEQMAIAQKGTGATAGIVGGTVAATTAAAAATQATTAAAAVATTVSGGGIVAGSGNTANGICSCSCFCGVAAFPAAVQGLAAIGGISGSMPAAAMMM